MIQTSPNFGDHNLYQIIKLISVFIVNSKW